MMIEVKNLTKKFKGLTAVNDISFSVRRGEVFGFLGPNGAGKTTTIRMLTGIIEPAAGTVIIDGYNMQKDSLKAKQLMGIVPEMANVYPDFTAFKNLSLMGELYGLGKKERAKRAGELLKLFGLAEKKNKKAKTFSKGLKQRLIIAMGLMNSPKLLFLDEPTSGLDVESVRLIRKLIGNFNEKKGVTIFLTTHNMEEAGQLCDRIAIMNHGQIVAIERPEKLRHFIKGVVSVEVAFSQPVKKNQLVFGSVSEIEKIGDKLRLRTEQPEELIPALVKYSQSSGNKIVSLNTLTPGLEDIFLELIKEK